MSVSAQDQLHLHQDKDSILNGLANHAALAPFLPPTPMANPPPVPDERLPQELKECILNELAATNDHISLATCALAHRSLLTPSQTHIFHTIHLRTAALTARFLHLLSSSPHLAPLVRALHVEEEPNGHGQWIARSTDLAAVLRRLPGINHLFLRPSSVCYAVLPESLRAALLETLPSLQTLHLTCVFQLPLLIFDRLQSVRSLRLSWVSFDRAPAPPSSASTRRPLSNLALCLTRDNHWVLVQRLLDPEGAFPLDVHALRSLRLDVLHARDTRWQDDACKVLEQCSDTLQALELGAGVPRAFDYNPDDMSVISLASMRQLKILALRDVLVSRSDDEWGWLRSLLATVPDIEHLIIDFSPKLHPIGQSGIWEWLDQNLTSGHLGKSLKSVTLHIPAPRHIQVDMPATIENLRQQMGTLGEVTRLKLCVKPVAFMLVRPSLIPSEILDCVE
ncbi:uncharacterized protein SCHCODRAFT_02703618 [Schizophyllum commune H4-8]|nr:uncharacterized protein SCHCODRAFT_02703618 [Schizophyllum commune H4-8]KAI5889188.1 hypothetical protein SCHCODRAFT_02703618 [Schizophyllum commune H4-8]